MRDLLAEDGSIYVHCDWWVNRTLHRCQAIPAHERCTEILAHPGWTSLARHRSDRQDEIRVPKAASILERVKQLLELKPEDKSELYSLHAPEVEGISKGKIRQPYELGVKVMMATTHREGFVAGMRSLPGNPYDGHTLPEAIEQFSILTN